ncbi:hypothetical protein MPER_12023 [Moniliophthora perniciosa FA553]|nr:hypothetical protein MPER_12023 [Moniliophthora perniciosa FA553]
MDVSGPADRHIRPSSTSSTAVESTLPNQEPRGYIPEHYSSTCALHFADVIEM